MYVPGRSYAFAVLLTCVLCATAQVPSDKVNGTFTVSEGLEFKLWASEPLLVNPTCVDIDHKGRVWVCESVNYRHSLHHRPPLRPQGDRIVILEDATGSGRADKATTFYQSPTLLAPMGIAVAKDASGPGYKVYVCQSPDILVFEDRDGDGKADGPPTKLLSGFKGIDHDHGVHGISIGPDGRLYFSVGDQGVDGLPATNGKRWTTNHSDCQGGTIWRCDLDGRNLELVAHNFRNEYEPCVDSFGDIFASDNDDDGQEQTRICYVMPGGNYGYWPRGRGESHWHEEQPGIVPKILRTYFGSPTGMCVYEGTLLPDKYQGQLLHTDAGPRHVRCYHMQADGAAWAVNREDIVKSTDNWFRPADVSVAADGAVFVADWYDPGVGGHGMGDTTRGRIYRLAPTGNRPRFPLVNLTTNEGLLAALASPALSVRYMAIKRIQAMPPDQAVSCVEPAIEQRNNRWLRARALWQIGHLTKERPDRCGQWIEQTLRDPDPRFRILALRLLKDTGQLAVRLQSADAERLINDPSAAVRREMLLLLRDSDVAESKRIILELAKHYDGQDHFYLAAIGIAVGQDPSRRSALLADFEREFPDWNARTANLTWELRPASMLPVLQRRLTDASLATPDRNQIVDVLAGFTEEGAGLALVTALGSRLPADVRDHIVEKLALFLPGKWRLLRTSDRLTVAIDELLAARSTRAGALALISAAERTDLFGRVLRIAQDEKENILNRRAAVRAMGLLPCREAVARLGEMADDGKHTLAIREEAIAALARQGETKDQRGYAALTTLRMFLNRNGEQPTLRRAGLVALAGSRVGAGWLLDAQARKEIPAEFIAEAGRLLRNSPYHDIQNRALLTFPLVRLDLKRLPAIDLLAKRRGNAIRGKQILDASVRGDLQCLKCHTIRGVGGNIGPDLSTIGEKGSRDNLLESILYPSKAIADQYVTWVVATNSGLAISGLLIEETTSSITLRDANGKDTKIEKREIEARRKSPDSLMPSDLLAYMSEEDLLDIVEYLLELKPPTGHGR